RSPDMKRLVPVILVVLAFVLLTVGCRRPFEGIDEISTVDSATLADTENATGVVIDLKPVRDVLAGAQWIDAQPINKGGYWLRVEGFPNIFVSEVNGCFWMTDYTGLFQIADDERSKFYEYLDGQARNIHHETKPPETE
ncbi:hypothetical protein, partial [Haloferula sp.]|uniref:hypothetical protein n=1 Tax=Haloferula sp. TaxID=2497595 RepID=UPI003C7950BD